MYSNCPDFEKRDDRENTDSNSSSDQMSYILNGDEVGVNWLRHKHRFLVASLACSGDIINIWRYPVIAHRHGGVIFLAVFLVYALIGWPIYALELALGQISSERGFKGHCLHNFTLLLKGLDISAAVYIVVILVYDVTVVTWVLLYVFTSIQDVVPWSECGNSTHTTDCVLSNETRIVSICERWNDTCVDEMNTTKLTVPVITSSRYFLNSVAAPSSGLDDLGTFSWPLFLCLLAAWFIVFLNTIKGKLTVKKRAVTPTIIILLLLTGLLSLSFNNKGAVDGILKYLQFKGGNLGDPLLWNDALIQVVLTLNIGSGMVPYFSRIGKHHQRLLIESAGVAIINMAVCYYCGLIAFSWLGVMANTAKVPITKILPKDLGFSIVVFSSAIASLPVPQLWSVFLFLFISITSLKRVERILITLAFNLKQIVNMRLFRERRRLFILTLCCVFSCIGVIFTYGVGYHLFFVLDNWVIGYGCLLLSVLEIAAICWLYGLHSLFNDLREVITDERERRFWKFVWTVITPGASIALLVFTSTNIYLPWSGSFRYGRLAQIVGWCLIILVLSPCFIYLLSIILKLLWTKQMDKPNEQSITQVSTVEGTSRQSLHSFYEHCLQQRRISESPVTYHVLLVTSEEKSSLPGIPCGFLLSPAKQKLISKPQAKLLTPPEITITSDDSVADDETSIRQICASSSRSSLHIPYYQSIDIAERTRQNEFNNYRLRRRSSSDTNLIKMYKERGILNEAYSPS